MNAPDLIAPVLGFRQWRLVDDGLRSLACPELWSGPTLVARCHVGGHPPAESPESACSCGVHAWYTPCGYGASAPTRDVVAGAVVLWGPIELHASGMRARYCRVVALELPLSRRGKRDRVRAVARRFGVPAVGHRHLPVIAARYGAPVPAGLRPPTPRCRLAAADRYRTDDGGVVVVPRGAPTAARRPGTDGAPT